MLSFLFLLPSFTYSQWRPLNTAPISEWLNSTYFSDDDHGWIVGQNGVILKFDPLLYEWNIIPTGNTQDLTSVAFFDNSNGIAVGANGTIIRTSDGGNNWQLISSGTSQYLNQAFVSNSTTAWVVGSQGTIIKTTNSGQSWAPINIQSNGTLLSVNFINSEKGFVGTDSAHLFITTNGGANWSEQILTYSNWFMPPAINAISFPDALIGYIGGGIANLETFCLKTTDGGITWNPGPQSPGMVRSISFRDDGNGIITGGDDTYNRFLQVIKNGISQTVISNNEDFDIMSCFITPSGKGWACGGGGAVFYADNYKEDWGQVLIGGEDQPMTLSVSHDKYFFLASFRNDFRVGGDVFQRSFHQNRIWKDVSHGFFNIESGNIITNSCMIDSMSGFNLWDYGELDRTNDGGYSWNSISSPGPGGIFFLNRSTGWFFSDTIYKTTDTGITIIPQYFPGFTVSDLRFIDANIGYACGSDGTPAGKVIKSTDGGANWLPLSIPTTGPLSSVAFSNPDTGIVIGWGNTILLTYNGGESWNYSSSGQKIKSVDRYSTKPIKTKNDRRYLHSVPSGSLFKETKVASDGNYLDAEFKGSNIFIASDSGFVMSSTNFGNSWNKSNIGSAVLQIKYDGGQYAAVRLSDNIYLLKMDTSGILAINDSKTSPKTYNLSQNYPNPFNPSTTIQFDLPENTNVNLSVYNLLGQLVKTLIDGKLPAGQHQTVWNAVNLASGIYLYRLITDNFSSVKKLILLK